MVNNTAASNERAAGAGPAGVGRVTWAGERGRGGARRGSGRAVFTVGRVRFPVDVRGAAADDRERPVCLGTCEAVQGLLGSRLVG